MPGTQAILQMRRGEMQQVTRRMLGLFAVTALTLAGAGKAQAHAILLDSTPAINATMPPGKLTLQLRYNSRIDRKRSRLTLTLPDRSTQILPIMDEGGEDTIVSHADLPAGQYSLRWQVLAVDGHITRGDIFFTLAGR